METIRAREGAKFSREATSSPVGYNTRKFSVIDANGDFLTCYAYSPDGRQVIITQVFCVMKPWTLRRTEWDGTGPDSSGVSYTYVNDNERVATLGPITESQKITPDYRSGDVIYADQVSEVFTVANETNPKTRWMDVNRDGRAWAHLDPSGS